MKREFKKYDVKQYNNFREVLYSNAQEVGEKPAFRFREKGNICSVTYKEFHDDTLFLGNALAEMGLSSKHVACIGDNCYRWLVVYLTMLNSNGVFVPLDRQLPTNDIATVLNHSDAEVLFFTKKYEKALNEIRDSLTCVKTFICIDGEIENAITYESVIERGKLLTENGYSEYINQAGDTNALRVLVYTSGTTGMAKGVMLSEKNIVSCVMNGMKLSKLYDRSISLLPYHHTYEACGILAALSNRTTIGINDSIRNLMKNFKEYRPEIVYLVPSFLEVFQKKICGKIGNKMPLIKALMAISNGLRKIGIDLRRVLFSSILREFGGDIKKAVSGGAPLRPETADFFDSIGINVVNGFGITECAPLISITRDNYEDCSTAGVPIDCISVKIENKDENGIGEICVKGSSVMLGYYKNEEETNKVMKDGWFNTGDLGYLDNEGRITVTGRKKNMIVLKNGKNVFPEELENYIMAIPYIKETAVTSYKNSSGEECGLCAHVYVGDESELKGVELEAQLRKDIDDACRHLPHYKHINKIIIRDEEFVKTTTNKIKRMEI